VWTLSSGILKGFPLGQSAHMQKMPHGDSELRSYKSAVPIFYVPGVHDVLEDDGKRYLQRFGKGTRGAGWHSFDKSGVHFIGLVNVVNLKPGGLGTMGNEQLERLEKQPAREIQVIAKTFTYAFAERTPQFTDLGLS
jgi:hypothetical protein